MNYGIEDAQPADDGDPREEIARLEARLEQLDEALARCRKIKLMAQIAITGGGAWMAAAVVGLVGLDPIAMLAAISGVIGGTVMYGSNTTSTKEVTDAIAGADAARAELIEGLDLEVVGERNGGRR